MRRFQTLKGSLQTISLSRKSYPKQVSNPQRIATNIVYIKQNKIILLVSNPQRIATNMYDDFSLSLFISMFQTLKGSLQTCMMIFLYLYLFRCFKPSKDRYKLRSSSASLTTKAKFQTLKGSLQTLRRTFHTHGHLLFQTLKGSLQTLEEPGYAKITMVFQTLKGSLQTSFNSKLRPQRRSFKPSKDRYKPREEDQDVFLVSRFKPSKDRYKRLNCFSNFTTASCFKPSKDRYKRVICPHVIKIQKSFKPSKDRYKPPSKKSKL